ncbi:uncharacterized protein VTP21DRAFT_2634 [Calcarisporiella thermophila]|uniref:uncharacterized protein n=1 Tax=Calcarisporiella thermophila TaxID=911321 RepID=UPI0037420485
MIDNLVKFAFSFATVADLLTNEKPPHLEKTASESKQAIESNEPLNTEAEPLLNKNVNSSQVPPPISTEARSEIISKWLGIPRQAPLKVGVLLGNNLDTYDLTQATRMFSLIPDTEILTIAETEDPVVTYEGVSILPDHTFEESLELDVLVIVANIGPDPSISTYLRKVGPTIKKYIITICQGSMVLAASGLLDGKQATTVKMLWPMTRMFSQVKWVKQARFTHDGNIITTSGATAGLDGILYAVQLLYGEKVAHTLAEISEYKWNSDPSHDPFTDLAEEFPIFPSIFIPVSPSFNLINASLGLITLFTTVSTNIGALILLQLREIVTMLSKTWQNEQYRTDREETSTRHKKRTKRGLPVLPKTIKDGLQSRVLRIPRQKSMNVGVLIGNNMDSFNMMSASTMLSFIPDVHILPIAENSDLIRTMDGFRIKPMYTFQDHVDLDLLVVPAGVGPNSATTSWLRRVIPSVKKYVLTICEGSMTLAATGYLNGKSATTAKSLWKSTELFPQVKWSKRARFTHDEKFITTSGATAGLDGVFYTAQLIYGEDVARKIAKVNEYDWNLDPNLDSFSNLDKEFDFVPHILFPSFTSFRTNNTESDVI